MSEIAFLASSKPFNIPDEIEEYNNCSAFKREEDISFSLFKRLMSIGKYIYQTINGRYQLSPKKWVEKISHRKYLSPYGITTFVNY